MALYAETKGCTYRYYVPKRLSINSQEIQMGQESDKKPNLTLNDPVDASTVQRIGELLTRRHQLGDMMLDVEQEKVRILVESRRVDDERTKLFANILTSRGLSPDTSIEIDPNNGKLSLMHPQVQQPPQAAAPPVEATPPP
jgi:hypothetical protein